MLAKGPVVGCSSKAERCDTVSDEVVRLAAEVAGTAERVLGFAKDRLGSVMFPESPAPVKPENSAEAVYPPLFSELRNYLRQTNSSLKALEECLTRVAL